MRIPFASLSLGCVLAMGPVCALAVTHSAATISGLKFTLIDLDPEDGVEPSFQVIGSAGATYSGVRVRNDLLDQFRWTERSRAGWFVEHGVPGEIAQAGALASIDALSLHASGHAQARRTTYSAAASTGSILYSESPGEAILNLSLSAKSRLLIEADASLLAGASVYQCSLSCETEYGQAEASLRLAYVYAVGDERIVADKTDRRSLLAEARAAGSKESKTLNKVLSASFENTSSFTQLSAMQLKASVWGAALTPIPEPQTCALAVGGLGIVLLLARRARA